MRETGVKMVSILIMVVFSFYLIIRLFTPYYSSYSRIIAFLEYQKYDKKIDIVDSINKNKIILSNDRIIPFYFLMRTSSEGIYLPLPHTVSIDIDLPSKECTFSSEYYYNAVISPSGRVYICHQKNPLLDKSMDPKTTILMIYNSYFDTIIKTPIMKELFSIEGNEKIEKFLINKFNKEIISFSLDSLSVNVTTSFIPVFNKKIKKGGYVYYLFNLKSGQKSNFYLVIEVYDGKAVNMFFDSQENIQKQLVKEEG